MAEIALFLSNNLKEIAFFLLGLIFGGLISWYITQRSDKKSSKEQNALFKKQNALFNKLTEETREIILSDKRKKLSVLELNELIREKTIDEEVGESIPYMACPRCGSEDLERTSDVEVDYGSEGPELACHYDIVRCNICDWTKTSHGHESPREDI